MRYRALLSGSSWREGPAAEFRTIREAREWAESYGAMADECAIIDQHRWVPRADHPRREHPVVAVHRRDRDGGGTRWYRATPPPPPVDDGATVDRDQLADLVWGHR